MTKMNDSPMTPETCNTLPPNASPVTCLEDPDPSPVTRHPSPVTLSAVSGKGAGLQCDGAGANPPAKEQAPARGPHLEDNDAFQRYWQIHLRRNWPMHETMSKAPAYTSGATFYRLYLYFKVEADGTILEGFERRKATKKEIEEGKSRKVYEDLIWGAWLRVLRLPKTTTELKPRHWHRLAAWAEKVDRGDLKEPKEFKKSLPAKPSKFRAPP